ncbi:hypothetical protein CB1_001253004 [Camelus ferus]|nr:hypothetical protein CB1_001253004 [Camelus ferus]
MQTHAPHSSGLMEEAGSLWAEPQRCKARARPCGGLCTARGPTPTVAHSAARPLPDATWSGAPGIQADPHLSQAPPCGDRGGPGLLFPAYTAEIRNEAYILDGFCTYLQLVYSEQADALARQKEVSFQLPAVLQGLSYGGPVLRILSATDDTLIMIREDGAIYFWSLQLKLKRRKNRELQLYELSNLEPYCQIGGLEAVPLKLAYQGHLQNGDEKAGLTGLSYEDPDKCLILYGDDQIPSQRLNVSREGNIDDEWRYGELDGMLCAWKEKEQYRDPEPVLPTG